MLALEKFGGYGLRNAKLVLRKPYKTQYFGIPGFRQECVEPIDTETFCILDSLGHPSGTLRAYKHLYFLHFGCFEHPTGCDLHFVYACIRS